MRFQRSVFNNNYKIRFFLTEGSYFISLVYLLRFTVSKYLTVASGVVLSFLRLGPVCV